MPKYMGDVYIAVTLYITAESEEAAQAEMDAMSIEEIGSRYIRLGDNVEMSPAVTFYPQGIEDDAGKVVERTKATVDEKDD